MSSSRLGGAMETMRPYLWLFFKFRPFRTDSDCTLRDSTQQSDHGIKIPDTVSCNQCHIAGSIAI